MARIEEHILKLRDEFNAKLERANSNTNRLRKNISKTQNSFKSLQGFAVRAFGALAIVGTIKKVASLGIEMEQNRVSFETFLGSAEKANAAIAQLQQFANVTPFDTRSVVRAGKALIAFGTPLEKLPATIKAIGDISAGTGKDFNELAVIFGKARTQGTLFAEDINQLTEAGIPIIDEFAKQFGVTAGEVKKLGSQGKISFANLEQAFADMTGEGGRFFNLMEKQSKTAGGQISTLVGTLQNLGVELGEALLPVIKLVVGRLQSMVTWIQKNKDVVALWGKRILIAIGIIGSLVAVIKTIVFVMKTWKSIQIIINALLIANPIGLIVAGIAALIAIVTLVIVKYDEWGAALTFLLGPLGLIINLVQSFRRNWDAIKKTFETGGILQGLLKIGAVLIDALLMPLQQLLELAEKIPGIGDLAGRGAEKILALRKRLGVETEKQKEEAAAPGQPEAIDTTPGGLTTLASTALASGNLSKEAGISTISGKTPRTININIESLIKENNINLNNVRESMESIRETITEILLEALNDATLSFK